MTHWADDKTNVPAAVHDRLLQIARSERTTFDAVAVRYATERLLYRLSESEHADRFVLKGAWLFYLWRIPRRITRDVDFLGHGDSSVEHITEVIREVSQRSVTPDDGLVFEAASIDSQELQEAEAYSGVRVRITAKLGAAHIRTQIDVGFGETLVQAPAEAELPVLLEYPPPRLRAYNAEASIAEKLEAMVRSPMSSRRDDRETGQPS